ncbi:MAG TPA: chemotaxis protein CheA [Thermodesulfovibrionales bacterium]|nr:chemotaxis protein CheA [Thermodesulfovibrionales bacterium]
MKSSKKDFVAEAGELIEEAERLLIEIQETSATGINPDTINALFRAVHTIKGISGLFGFRDVADFSHAFESLLDDLRLGRIEVTEELIRFLFSNSDILRNVIEDIEAEKEHDLSGPLKNIEAFRSATKGSEGGEKIEEVLARIDSAILKVLSEYEEHRLKANIRDGKGIYLAKAVFDLNGFDTALNDLTSRIKSLGEQVSALPTSDNLPPDSIGFNVLFGSGKSADEIRQALNLPVDELIMRKAEAPAVSLPKMQESSIKSSSTYVRVDIEKLDRILNTISELNLARAATNRIGIEMAEQLGHSPLVADVFKISQTFERKIADLKEQVLEIRMIPVGQIFSRLGQVIRRYSRDSGKQIDLTLYGEDTEIDKYLAEEIVDPLMHIVRNAIDHGIETAEERKKAGKKESGTIMLKAFQRGNHVVIEARDDGAGIDLEKVKKKAFEKGLLLEGDEPSNREVLDFIFMAGFSTKATVSEISGRGVGMDVVREKLSTLGGFVEVETERGQGTAFILTVPITLAILKALMVRIGPERFAIPLTSMSESLLIEHKEVQTIEGKEVFNLRGEMLPMVSAARMFGLEGDASDRSYAVVVGYGERRLGLFVDELIGQHEVVIKSLGGYFGGLRGFAGAAEIGKHEVILVIDVESVIEESLFRQRATHHV